MQMDRNNLRTSSTKACSLIASVAFLSVVTKVVCSTYDQNFNSEQVGDKRCPNVNVKPTNEFLMLVSTLDGKVSALNVRKEGLLEWNVNTGHGPLLSSSISNLEINRDGRRARLIPSLDGGLYQYDGVAVEPVPFTADTLLSSSLRLNDQSIMVGGKETETYGIDVPSGKVKYVCDIGGCQVFDKDAEGRLSNESETLLISRTSRTVRAVDMISGTEKWNFSVGEHELVHVSASKRQRSEQSPEISDESQRIVGGASAPADDASAPADDVSEPVDDDDIHIENCGDSEFVADDESMFSFPWWNESGGDGDLDESDIDFKVIVPRGLILAVRKSDPNHVLWQHTLDVAIAKAWVLRRGQLDEVNLFDGKHVPALVYEGQSSAEHMDDDVIYPPDTPALYIGTHDRQFYVQPSVQMLHAVEDTISRAVTSQQLTPINMPRVTWKPYIASSPSRTPAEQRNPLQITWERSTDDDVDSEAEDANLWCHYPHDVGYYVYPDTSPMPLITEEPDNGSHKTDDFFFEETITVTLWNWWREVAAISVLSSILLNLFIMRVFFPRAPVLIMSPSNSDQAMVDPSNQIQDMQLQSVVSDGEKVVVKEEDYVSRYESDFEQVVCLGRGGFGVVFEVKNKLDDYGYAIKRITLHNSEKAKEKVMREVKALAKLEHAHIVRYHQAWFECPPAGWQEQRDKHNLPPSAPDVNTYSPPAPYPHSSQPFSTGTDHHTPLSRDDSHDWEQSANNRRVRQRRKQPNIARRAVANRAAAAAAAHDFNPLKPFGHSQFDCDTFAAAGGDSDVMFDDDTTVDDDASFDMTHSFAEDYSGNARNCAAAAAAGDQRKWGSTGPFFVLHDFSDESSDQGTATEVRQSTSATNDLAESQTVGFLPNHDRLKTGAIDDSSSLDISFRDDVITASANTLLSSAAAVPFCDNRSSAHRSSRDQRLTNHDRCDDDSLDIVFEHSTNTDSHHRADEHTSSAPSAATTNSSVSLPGHHHRASGGDPRNNDNSVAMTSHSTVTRASGALEQIPVNNNKRQNDNKNSIDDDQLKSPPGAPQSSTSTPPQQKLYLYIQMQLCQKTSLKEWLANAHDKKPNVLLDIFAQTVSAVAYVHDSGLMHRDLKPSNIFFSMDGTVKVGDFGLATALEEKCEEGDTQVALPANTPVDGVCMRKHTDQVGTKLYMSPEQIDGKSYSHKVDIFALGLILFELFHDPFVTQMERVSTLCRVKQRQFPAKFTKQYVQQHQLANNLLSPKPDDRLAADDILSHPLFTEQNDYCMDHVLKSRSRSRSRTMSQSSGNSATSLMGTSLPKNEDC